jgi:hypothetical protein
VSHNEPIAWAVMLQGGNRIYDVYATEEEAKAIDAAVVGNHGVVPLYRSPTLADAEREAIGVAVVDMANAITANTPVPVANGIRRRAAELWKLLERTK